MIDRSRFVAAIMMTALLATPAVAQKHEGGPDPKIREARADLVRELAAWAKTNIVPQLKTWKAKLDGAMAADDLMALNRLRSRSTALRLDFVLTGSALRDAWRDEDYDALKKERNHLKELLAQRKAILEELKPIAMKYRSTLEAIGAEAKPKVEAWKTEKQQMVARWADAHKESLGDRPMPMGKFGAGHGMAGLPEDMRKKIAAARFMLWDGGDDSGTTIDDEDGDVIPELR